MEAQQPYLLSMGYTMLHLEKGWWGVQLKNPFTNSNTSNCEPTNYLATIDIATVQSIFKKYGYQCSGYILTYN